MSDMSKGNLEKLFGKEMANLIVDDHILRNWKFPEGVTGVLFETTEENRHELYDLISKKLKEYEVIDKVSKDFGIVSIVQLMYEFKGVSDMLEEIKKHILKINNSNDTTIEEAWEGVLRIMEKRK